MLQAISDRASGWIAYVIVFLISVPFALWGINSYFGGGDPRVAAEVNGEQIPLRAFNTQLQQQRRYLEQRLGANALKQVDVKTLKTDVIERMIADEVVKQTTQAAGYRVSDQVLLDRIHELEVFQRDGRFDKQRYEQLLSAQGRSKAGFEQGLRQQIRLAQFEGGIRQSAFLTTESRRDFERLQNQTRELAYFLISKDAGAFAEQISDDAIGEYYQAHKSRYRTPEQVKLAYVELDEKNLANDIHPDENTLFERYRNNKDQYVKPQERKVRHILLKVPPEADEAEREAVRRQAEKLASQARSGEDFAKLAEAHSQDKLSADKGGNLGYLARGDMAPALEKVIFSLPEGEISDPVRTEAGLQIVQVTDIKPAQQQPFEAVRDEVEKNYKQSEARSRFADQAQQLLTLSYEQPGTLEPAADAIGADIQTTDWITSQGGRGLAKNPKVRAAAFSEEVLEKGRNSDLLELGDGHAVVLRATDHEPPLPVPLEGVRDRIKQTLAQQAARKAAAKSGQQALKALRDGGSLKAQAEHEETKLESPGFVDRDAEGVPAPILDKLFTLPKPQGDEGASYGGLRLSDGGYAVMALRGVREEGGSGGDADAQTQAAGGQAQRYSARELQAIQQTLRARADVTIMQDNL